MTIVWGPGNRFPRRAGGQRGGALGCAFLLLALGVLVGGSLLATRGLASPALGGPPEGPAHGVNDLEIGSALAPLLVRGLASHPHAVVVLSEQDLTVLARTHNPNPDQYRDPEVRVRQGRLVVSARSALAGQAITGVARLDVALAGQGETGSSGVSTRLAELDVGQLPIPDWARSALSLPTDRAVDPSLVLQGNPTLRRLVGYLDCVGVAGDGLRMGFHRPGAPPDPAGCDVPPGPG